MNFEQTVDLVIVGSGLAAHRAALEASSLGAEVLMVEKMDSIGGSTVMSGGSFAFAGTEQQRAQGIDDSVQRLRNDLLSVGGGEADTALVDLYVDEQLNEYNWLRGHGVVFSAIQLSSGQSVPRSHPCHPGVVLRLLNTALSARSNVRIMTGTRAKRLRRSRSGGPIDQVMMESAGKAVTVTARRGVILATGGFSRSEQLLKLFVPEILAALRAGGKGNEGDGLVMGWEHGAGFADLGFVKSTFGSYIEVDEAEPHTTLLPVYRGAIAVNLKAERFIAESRSYKTLGLAVLRQPSARAWQIFDHSIMSQSVAGVPSFDFDAAMKKGRIIQADTLSGLAELAGLDAATLQDTVDTYNADISATGKDSRFERKALAHEYGELVPIQSAPFYGYLCTASINSTYAGLCVNASMAVLNVYGEAIEGLFAAGEVVGGFHGEAYMTGSSLVKALVFGKTAARTALTKPNLQVMQQEEAA